MTEVINILVHPENQINSDIVKEGKNKSILQNMKLNNNEKKNLRVIQTLMIQKKTKK